MESAVSQSTFFLTMLLGVGLFFFIKASTKDRTEIAEFSSDQSPEVLHQRLIDYFENRAYRLLENDADSEGDSSVKLVGLVRPSVFLAIFLTFLAAVALLCFALVLATLFKSYGVIFFALVLLSPTVAILYWKRAKREEEISFRIHEINGSCKLTIRGHRDEIIQFRTQKPFS
ncbi:cofactor assembly of complex C subunit B [Leptothoe spongobia]|uniref:Cofactor assembly of complex C subunit B n=1 Tax=Leptothoe spongobia TAU-MAC 1115 TaxID=1967444 RepID=A0A947DI88_9CYAN|nr:cofactor assembly of complex C subunit B [Leptothoe spongobia]MBT9316416.1 cofactor assembly of complex C subunit B [Leptothoe spongobia TAU-MAC 1115]